MTTLIQFADLQWPEDRDKKGSQQPGNDRQWDTDAQVVAKRVSARSHDDGISLVAHGS